MGFFGNLFKSKEEREVEEMFKQISFLLNDDEAQMDYVPPFFLDMYDKRPMNTVPGARGEFGRSETNPIPVNGPLGEVTYLSKLLVEDTCEKVFFHRFGSCSGNLDIFELISLSGNFHDILYLDMYHTHKSQYAPSGYVFQKGVINIRGIHNLCKGFPNNFYNDLVDSTKNLIGFPCFDTDAKFIDINNALRTMGRR